MVVGIGKLRTEFNINVNRETIPATTKQFYNITWKVTFNRISNQSALSVLLR